MSLSAEDLEAYAERLPASFAGIEFQVDEGGVSGSFESATELQVGRGSKVIPIAAGVDGFVLRGSIIGTDALERQQRLIAAFKAGVGALQYPWLPSLQALVTSWDFRNKSGDLNHVMVEFTAQQAELPEVADTGQIPATSAEALEQMTTAGAAFADEPAAMEQFELLRASLLLEPPGLENEAFASQVTGELLESSSTPADDVPMAVQQIGAGVRAADAGELTVERARGIEDTVLVVAQQYDSLTLMNLRETFSLFLTALGSGAIATVSQGRGETVQAIAVATGTDLDIVARRNRSAVANFFARGEVIR